MYGAWLRYKSYKISYWCAYTLFFILAFGLVFVSFYFGKYSFVNVVDGLDQQYVSLLYFHRWGQAVLDTFVATGKWEFPVWDLHIGLGDEIFTTIFYYICVSPINLAAVFCPEALLEHLYALEFIFRLFLAGVSFSVFARWHKKSNWGVLLGSITYCFCGFVIQKGIQHTFFVMPMIFLPLMLLGVDKILKKQSPLLFVLSTSFCAITNFYFFYMVVLAVVLYFFGQMWFSGERSVLKWTKWIGKFMVYGLIAVALSGFIFIPSAYAMLGSNRMGGGRNHVPLLYSISYYYQLLWGSGTNKFRDFDSRTGFALPVLAAVFLLWVKKGRTKLKVYFTVLFLFLCIPFFGSALNGFGYVSNRWIFIFSFLLSYIFVEMYPCLLELTETDTWKLLIFTGIYLLSGAVIVFVGIQESTDLYRNSIHLFALVILLGYLAYKKTDRKFMQIFLILATILSIAVNGYLEFFPTRGGAVSAYIKRGDVLREYTVNLPSNDLLQIEDIGKYRSNVSHGISDRSNSYMIQEIPGTQFYFSVVEGNVNTLLTEMYYNYPLEHQYNGFQDRLVLNSLAGVKYFLSAAEDQTLAEDPAFTEVINVNSQGRIFENIYAMPMAYLYETYIPREYYDSIDVVDKQEAMAQGAVMEKSSLPETDIHFTSYEIDYELYSDSLRIEDNNFVSDVENAEVILTLERIPKDAEVYVIMEGIKWEGMDPITQNVGGNLENADWYYRQIIRAAQLVYTEDDSVSIDINMSGHAGTVTYYTPSHRMYCGRENFLCNLGYVSEGTDQITLRFHKNGTYTFDRIRVVAQPRGPIEVYLSNLQSAGVEDWNFLTNAMGGNVVCEKDAVLCVPIPYSEGWSAYVDGMETKVERINSAFMGVVLDAGEHDVKFIYHIPCGRIGIICSLLGVIAVIVLIVWHAIVKRREIANQGIAVIENNNVKR